MILLIIFSDYVITEDRVMVFGRENKVLTFSVKTFYYRKCEVKSKTLGITCT